MVHLFILDSFLHFPKWSNHAPLGEGVATTDGERVDLLPGIIYNAWDLFRKFMENHGTVQKQVPYKIANIHIRGAGFDDKPFARSSGYRHA